ncbi:hypothetical protein E4U28_008089 [Claviceps purpurea]|nr:hypothetical protein E4U28_008089 [Claviceps purpurea]
MSAGPFKDEERLEISTGKRSMIGVNTCDAQSDIIDMSAGERLRPSAKVQLLQRVPLPKYRLLRMQNAADERRINARMQSLPANPTSQNSRLCRRSSVRTRKPTKPGLQQRDRML